MLVLKCFVYKQLFGENMKGMITVKILVVGILLAILSYITTPFARALAFHGHESNISKPGIMSLSQGDFNVFCWWAIIGSVFAFWAMEERKKQKNL